MEAAKDQIGYREDMQFDVYGNLAVYISIAGFLSVLKAAM